MFRVYGVDVRSTKWAWHSSHDHWNSSEVRRRWATTFQSTPLTLGMDTWKGSSEASDLEYWTGLTTSILFSARPLKVKDIIWTLHSISSFLLCRSKDAASCHWLWQFSTEWALAYTSNSAWWEAQESFGDSVPIHKSPFSCSSLHLSWLHNVRYMYWVWSHVPIALILMLYKF